MTDSGVQFNNLLLPGAEEEQGLARAVQRHQTGNLDLDNRNIQAVCATALGTAHVFHQIFVRRGMKQ